MLPSSFDSHPGKTSQGAVLTSLQRFLHEYSVAFSDMSVLFQDNDYDIPNSTFLHFVNCSSAQSEYIQSNRNLGYYDLLATYDVVFPQIRTLMQSSSAILCASSGSVLFHQLSQMNDIAEGLWRYLFQYEPSVLSESLSAPPPQLPLFRCSSPFQYFNTMPTVQTHGQYLCPAAAISHLMPPNGQIYTSPYQLFYSILSLCISLFQANSLVCMATEGSGQVTPMTLLRACHGLILRCIEGLFIFVDILPFEQEDYPEQIQHLFTTTYCILTELDTLYGKFCNDASVDANYSALHEDISFYRNYALAIERNRSTVDSAIHFLPNVSTFEEISKQPDSHPQSPMMHIVHWTYVLLDKMSRVHKYEHTSVPEMNLHSFPALQAVLHSLCNLHPCFSKYLPQWILLDAVPYQVMRTLGSISGGYYAVYGRLLLAHQSYCPKEHLEVTYVEIVHASTSLLHSQGCSSPLVMLIKDAMSFIVRIKDHVHELDEKVTNIPNIPLFPSFPEVQKDPICCLVRVQMFNRDPIITFTTQLLQPSFIADVYYTPLIFLQISGFASQHPYSVVQEVVGAVFRALHRANPSTYTSIVSNLPTLQLMYPIEQASEYEYTTLDDQSETCFLALKGTCIEYQVNEEDFMNEYLGKLHISNQSHTPPGDKKLFIFADEFDDHDKNQHQSLVWTSQNVSQAIAQFEQVADVGVMLVQSAGFLVALLLACNEANDADIDTLECLVQHTASVLLDDRRPQSPLKTEGRGLFTCLSVSAVVVRQVYLLTALSALSKKSTAPRDYTKWYMDICSLQFQDLISYIEPLMNTVVHSEHAQDPSLGSTISLDLRPAGSNSAYLPYTLVFTHQTPSPFAKHTIYVHQVPEPRSDVAGGETLNKLFRRILLQEENHIVPDTSKMKYTQEISTLVSEMVAGQSLAFLQYALPIEFKQRVSEIITKSCIKQLGVLATRQSQENTCISLGQPAFFMACNHLASIPCPAQYRKSVTISISRILLYLSNVIETLPLAQLSGMPAPAILASDQILRIKHIFSSTSATACLCLKLYSSLTPVLKAQLQPQILQSIGTVLNVGNHMLTIYSGNPLQTELHGSLFFLVAICLWVLSALPNAIDPVTLSMVLGTIQLLGLHQIIPLAHQVEYLKCVVSQCPTLHRSSPSYVQTNASNYDLISCVDLANDIKQQDSYGNQLHLSLSSLLRILVNVRSITEDQIQGTTQVHLFLRIPVLVPLILNIFAQLPKPDLIPCIPLSTPLSTSVQAVSDNVNDLQHLTIVKSPLLIVTFVYLRQILQSYVECDQAQVTEAFKFLEETKYPYVDLDISMTFQHHCESFHVRSEQNVSYIATNISVQSLKELIVPTLLQVQAKNSEYIRPSILQGIQAVLPPAEGDTEGYYCSSYLNFAISVQKTPSPKWLMCLLHTLTHISTQLTEFSAEPSKPHSRVFFSNRINLFKDVFSGSFDMLVEGNVPNGVRTLLQLAYTVITSTPLILDEIKNTKTEFLHSLLMECVQILVILTAPPIHSLFSSMVQHTHNMLVRLYISLLSQVKRCLQDRPSSIDMQRRVMLPAPFLDMGSTAVDIVIVAANKALQTVYYRAFVVPILGGLQLFTNAPVLLEMTATMTATLQMTLLSRRKEHRWAKLTQSLQVYDSNLVNVIKLLAQKSGKMSYPPASLLLSRLSSMLLLTKSSEPLYAQATGTPAALVFVLLSICRDTAKLPTEQAETILQCCSSLFDVYPEAKAAFFCTPPSLHTLFQPAALLPCPEDTPESLVYVAGEIPKYIHSVGKYSIHHGALFWTFPRSGAEQSITTVTSAEPHQSKPYNTIAEMVVSFIASGDVTPDILLTALRMLESMAKDASMAVLAGFFEPVLIVTKPTPVENPHCFFQAHSEVSKHLASCSIVTAITNQLHASLQMLKTQSRDTEMNQLIVLISMLLSIFKQMILAQPSIRLLLLGQKVVLELNTNKKQDFIVTTDATTGFTHDTTIIPPSSTSLAVTINTLLDIFQSCLPQKSQSKLQNKLFDTLNEFHTHVFPIKDSTLYTTLPWLVAMLQLDSSQISLVSTDISPFYSTFETSFFTPSYALAQHFDAVNGNLLKPVPVSLFSELYMYQQVLCSAAGVIERKHVFAHIHLVLPLLCSSIRLEAPERPVGVIQRSSVSITDDYKPSSSLTSYLTFHQCWSIRRLAMLVLCKQSCPTTWAIDSRDCHFKSLSHTNGPAPLVKVDIASQLDISLVWRNNKDLLLRHLFLLSHDTDQHEAHKHAHTLETETVPLQLPFPLDQQDIFLWNQLPIGQDLYQIVYDAMPATWRHALQTYIANSNIDESKVQMYE